MKSRYIPVFVGFAVGFVFIFALYVSALFGHMSADCKGEGGCLVLGFIMTALSSLLSLIFVGVLLGIVGALLGYYLSTTFPTWSVQRTTMITAGAFLSAAMALCLLLSTFGITPYTIIQYVFYI